MQAQTEWEAESFGKQTLFEVCYFMTCCIHWWRYGSELMRDEKMSVFPSKHIQIVQTNI